MSSWLKDYPDLLLDDRHAVVSRRDLERMDTYLNVMQPTSPSPGRVWATPDRSYWRDEPDLAGLVAVCWVERDPDSTTFVLRQSRPALVVDR